MNLDVTGDSKCDGCVRKTNTLEEKIPKKVQVGGITFDVDYPHTFKERTDIAGRIMFDTDEIFVGNKSKTGETCTNAHSFRVYLHEVFHAISKIYCADLVGTECDEEVLIDSLAVGTAQFLEDNYYMTTKNR